MSNIHLYTFAILFICAAVSFASGSIGQGDYEPRLLLLGVTEKGLSLPEGSTSAPYGACLVSPEISDILELYSPEIVTRVFGDFDPERYAEYDFIPPLEIFHSIRFAEDFDVQELARVLERVPGVLSAEPNFYIRVSEPDLATEEEYIVWMREKDLTSPPSDDLFWGIQDSSGRYDQWNLHDDGSGIGCEQAWTYTTGDPDVRIGILEDGVWHNHDDLSIAKGFRLRYDDFNGYVFDEIDTSTYNHHATQCAGIIGATTNNSFGIAGIAGGDGINAGCSIYNIQIDRSEHSFLTWAMALEEATDPFGDHQCNVISQSMSATPAGTAELLRAAVLFAYSVKANFVAAKGNMTTPPVRYPSGFDDHWLTSVGAYDSSGTYIFSANSGCMLDIVAPGEHCPTISIPDFQLTTPQIYHDQILSRFLYCSCATPHVAGAIGLLRSYLGNNLRAEDYANIITLSADDPVDNNPQTWDRHYGHGRLDIGQALQNVSEHDIHRLSTTNTSVVASDTVSIVFMSGPNTNLVDAIRCKVKGTIHFDPAFTGTPLCWGPGTPAYTFGFHGYSASLKNYREPFHEVVPSSVSADSCDVFTYTYKLWNDSNQDYTDWYPANPNQIPVTVCALGTRTGIKKHSDIPDLSGFSLYPNPFNAQVSVCYNVKQAGDVLIDVVDVRGVRIRRLHSGWTAAGDLDLIWDGADNSGRMMASGVYFVRVETVEGTTAAKLTLAK